MGSILAMVAIVTVVAGLATVTTSKLHGALAGSTVKPEALNRLLDEWRTHLDADQTALTRLKLEELDLLRFTVEPQRKLLAEKDTEAGHLATIYDEPIAYYVRRTFPKAKGDHALTLVRSARREIVYRQANGVTAVSVDDQPLGELRGGVLIAPDGKTELALLEAQRDERTLHVDTPGKTLAILLRDGGGHQAAPRAFEFVDATSDEELKLLGVITYDFLLAQNLQA